MNHCIVPEGCLSVLIYMNVWGFHDDTEHMCVLKITHISKGQQDWIKVQQHAKKQEEQPEAHHTHTNL